jgi:hypothetical protein
MKTWITAAAVAALTLIAAPESWAQVVVSPPGAPAPVLGGPVFSSSAYVPPYSYYAAWPWPARVYVPYGPGDAFPFYGRAYGHPYDRWTWPYLGGGNSRYLARYYYPPLR